MNGKKRELWVMTAVGALMLAWFIWMLYSNFE